MKKTLSYLAAAILVISVFTVPVKAVVNFDDVPVSHEFGYEIIYLHSENIANGYPDGTYRPYATVTRGEAMAMIGRSIHLNDTKRQTGFNDVAAGHPFSGYIASAVEQGIAFGYPDNTFRPNQTINRGQAAMLLQRAFNFPEGPPTGFSDMGPNVVSNDAVSALKYQGVANGYPDNRFRPESPVTRGQFSAFLARAVEPSFIPDKQALLETANDLLEDLQNENFSALADYVSEERGLTFCPYSGGCIDNGGVNFSPSQLNEFMNDQQEYLWGYQDGSGFPINLTPSEYYHEYLMDVPYQTKERYDRSLQHMTRDFIKQLYPQGTIVEFYFPGTEQYDGMDWQSLNMVFERNTNGEWILVAIINDRWTI